MNAAELELESVSIKSADSERITGDITLDSENEQATLTFPQTLAPGSWELRIGFNGILNDKLHGFYRSTYKNSGGEEKVLASTQFEATDARRAFPCWDEPAFKAVFAVTLVVDEGPHRDLQRARNRRETIRRRPRKKAVVFADTMQDVDLPGRLHRRRAGGDRAGRWSERTPLRVWSVPGKRAISRRSA